MSWQNIVIAVCLGLFLIACGSTMGDKGVTTPSSPNWDCLGDDESPACTDNMSTERRANVFHTFWEKAMEDGGQWVLAKGKAAVACAKGEFAGFVAMGKCKVGLECYYQGVEHTIELFYPGGYFRTPEEEDDDRVCAKCVCTRPPPKR